MNVGSTGPGNLHIWTSSAKLIPQETWVSKSTVRSLSAFSTNPADAQETLLIHRGCLGKCQKRDLHSSSNFCEATQQLNLKTNARFVTDLSWLLPG